MGRMLAYPMAIYISGHASVKGPTQPDTVQYLYKGCCGSQRVLSACVIY
ncbi:hypothetical protein HNR39_003069 [Glaciimonas immobilis]|uniref:Uncharacterized protein n=1 Tax=Glaciimonas immobilis TaxID=728004 RepID=A0A840RXP1_9BURK|nr:hypothetical protein [Glaciimonas immobilis]